MKRVFILSLMLTAFLFSCNNSEKAGNDQLEPEKQESVDQDICLELTYPITYILPDGTKVSGNNKDEIGSALKHWHATNPDVQERAVMQYPVKAIFQGSPVTIADEGEMQRYRKACQKAEVPCYAFVYPVSYIMPDATIITVEGIDDLQSKTAIREWYANNPDSKERPTMKYPMNVLLEDGSMITLNSEDELNKLREECE